MRVSIEAGAGTGKTTKVVRLLLDRLLAGDTEPSHLLALTFTVRAANEMRDRLGTWLARLVAGETVRELGGGLALFGDAERVRDRGRRALAELDRIEIGTIHSFAAHLLRQYPLEAGVSPAFEEDDGGVARALFRERWPRWLDARLAPPAEVERLRRFLERMETGDLAAFVEALCEDGVPLELAVDAERRRARRERLAGEAARARALRERHAGETGTTARRAADALDLMVALFEAESIAPGLRARAALLRPAFPKLVAWSGADRSLYTELRALGTAVIRADDALMAELLAWVRPFVEDFRREYGRRGHVSFQGLLEHARRLLRDRLDVRDHLKARFRVIVVDEFQDTDPVQGEILLYLAEQAEGQATDWRDVAVEPGKLLIVGDPKQSIYLFRGADLDAYAEIAERLTGGREDGVERLSRNYRARAELVRFVNAVGAGTMTAPRYVPLEPDRGGGGTIEMILFPTLDAEGARESEAEAIGEWIAAGIAAGRFRAGDVALLLRALGDTHHYTDAFRRRGIDFAIEGEKHFYAAQEVLDVLNLLGAIVDPTNELAVAGLLRSPLGAATDRELLHLRDARALCPLDPERVPALLPGVRRLYETLALLHERARRLPAAELLAEVTARFPLAAIARAGVRGEQAAANVAKLVRALAAEPGTTLATALADYRRRFDDREEEGEAPLADEQLDAVRILSIHKAKGLEFPVVVLPDLHRGQVRADEGPAVVHDWLSGVTGFRCGKLRSIDRIAIDERRRRIEEEERGRVLYVALTRARDTLLLTGGKMGEDTSLDMVARALGADGSTPEETLAGEGFTVAIRRLPRLEPAWEARAPAATGPEPDYAAEQARWLEREAAAQRAARRELLRRPSVPGEADVDRTFRFEREDDEAGGLTIGARCHDVLATLGLDAPDCAAAEPAVRAILEPFLASEAFEEIRTADEVHREVPFVVPLDGEVWSGQIDVLYRRGDRWIVADYKSDRVERPGRHGQQARVYAAAAARALGLATPPEFRLIYLRTGRVAVAHS